MLFSTLVALGCLQGANGAAYDKNAELLHCSSFDGGMPDWIKDGGWVSTEWILLFFDLQA